MKSLFLTLTITGAVLLSAPLLRAEDEKPEGGKGGGGRGRFSPEERLKMMTEKLGLSQEQQDKIKAIFDKNQPKVEEIRKGPEDQRREKMHEVMAAQREEVVAVLTPEQKEKMKTEMGRRGERGGKGKEGKDGKAPEAGEAR